MEQKAGDETEKERDKIETNLIIGFGPFCPLEVKTWPTTTTTAAAAVRKIVTVIITR